MVLDIPFVVLSSIVFLGVAIASYTDIKTREVPDELNYFLIIGGIVLRAGFAVAYARWEIFFSGVAGLALCFILAHVMYYTGQWGGGDSKLLMGIGVMLGLDFTFSPLPLLLLFLLNMIMGGAAYGVIWIGVLTARHSFAVLRLSRLLLHRARGVHILSCVISLVFLLVSLIISVPFSFRALLAVSSFFPLASFYLWVVVKAVEQVALVKKVSPTKLTEGDWLAKDVVVHGKRIISTKELGVSKEQIRRLVALYHQGKLKVVFVKEGIPFVPSFLLGFVLTFVFGDWFSSVVWV